MKMEVVIGANLGDEGKGKVVDILAARNNKAVVVRYHGGSQAAHTVQVDDKRVVMHHLSSGTLAGCKTYLAKPFIVNPIQFCKEMKAWNWKPVVLVHPKCRVTTPFDMLLNQAVEYQRMLSRHGSCGMGINETVQRDKKLPLEVSDFMDMNHVRDVLDVIKKVWVPKQMYRYNITSDNPLYSTLMNPDRVLERYMEDVLMFQKHTIIAGYRILKYRDIILEGSQGLMLDEEHEWFPHVTHSKVGLHHALNIADILGIREMDVHYVTRSYITRHGVGPLPTENPSLSLEISDKTNIPNEWQGALRCGALDVDYTKEMIIKDLGQVPSRMKVNKHLVVNCVDEASSAQSFSYVHKGIREYSTTGLIMALFDEFPDFRISVGNGPGRSSIKELQIKCGFVWRGGLYGKLQDEACSTGPACNVVQKAI